MDAYEIILLILGAGVAAAVVTGIEWLPRYLRRQASNWKLGVGHEPELRGELAKAFVIVWLCRTVQLGLLGALAWLRPSGVVLIAMLLAFGLCFVAAFPADRARRSLLA